MASAVDTATSFVSKCVIGKLEQELAVAVRNVLRLNDCLPRRWTTIETSAQGLAGLIVFPNRTFRLRHETGIKSSLLVCRRSEVIVREDRAERAVLARQIQGRVSKPALHGCLCAERSEERMRLRFERGLRRAVESLQTASGVDGMNALEDFAGSERAVFIVETVTRAVGRSHVKLHEVDVLAHEVGRRAHLEVVELVDVRCQVCVLERNTVVRVG